MDTPLFDLQGVAFSAGGRPILKPLDLSLAAARIYGLIGPNGSGKSTLLKMLARQLAPTSGSILLYGNALTGWSDRAFAREVAYMPQFTPAADGMNVRELVSLGRYPWHGPLGRFTAADAAKVDEALMRTGLDRFAGRQVDALSGGERQRVWLALMLAQDSKCLLLDEPTSALDLAHETETLALVRTLGRERGLTVIIVLHDINLAARTCDEIIAMRDGVMVAHAPPGAIMTPEELARIYGVPMGVLAHPTRDEAIGYVL